MELIPILSAIILIATISTFILAVGAYILYKMRERKGYIEKQQEYKQIEAEILYPRQKRADIEEELGRKEYIRSQFNKEAAPPKQKVYAENKKAAEPVPVVDLAAVGADKSPASKFLKYTSDGYVSIENSGSSEANKTKENLKWR